MSNSTNYIQVKIVSICYTLDDVNETLEMKQNLENLRCDCVRSILVDWNSVSLAFSTMSS